MAPSHSSRVAASKLWHLQVFKKRRRRRQAGHPLGLTSPRFQARESPSGASGGRPVRSPIAHCGPSICESSRVARSWRCARAWALRPLLSSLLSLLFLSREDFWARPSPPNRAGGSGEEGTRRGPLREAWQSAGANFFVGFFILARSRGATQKWT